MRPKVLHFLRIHFCELALWKLFARIYFHDWVLLKYFTRINFCDSAIFRYLTRTYFRELRKVANIYRIEFTLSYHLSPGIVTISLPARIKDHMLIQQCQSMIEELYCEPKEEVLMDIFL